MFHWEVQKFVSHQALLGSHTIVGGYNINIW